MHDFTVARDYGCDTDDVHYDPHSFKVEKIYRYVEPVERCVVIQVPDPADDAKEGSLIEQSVTRTVLEWTATGKAAFVRAREHFEKAARRCVTSVCLVSSTK